MRKDSSTPSRSPTSAANRVISPWISNAARHARTAWSSNARGAPNTAMTPSPVKLPTVPPYRCTTTAARLTNSAMISRSRSAPTAAAMSIECTTSANSTVTCLYSADGRPCVIGAPHSLQNFESGGSSVPHAAQINPVAVSPPPPSPLGSTSVSFHRCSMMSVISPCHLRHEVLRLSYVVYFETTFSSARAWSIWS